MILFSSLCELLKGMVKALCRVLFSARLLRNIRSQPMGSFFSIFKRQGDDLQISFCLEIGFECLKINVCFLICRISQRIKFILACNLSTLPVVLSQLEKLISKDSLHYEVICFHYYIQYHLHQQVLKVTDL